MELVVFDVGGSRYALSAIDVREVFRAVAITPLPEAPAIVEGVIDVRGEVLPVIDLRRRLGAPAVPVSAAEHFIAARAGSRSVIFRAGTRTQVVSVGSEQLREARQVIAGTGTVSGVATLPDGLVLIHDLRTFLSAAETGELDAALSAVARPAS